MNKNPKIIIYNNIEKDKSYELQMILNDINNNNKYTLVYKKII